MKKILIVLASPGENKKLAETLSVEIDKKKACFEIIDLCSLDLPLYHSTIDCPSVASKTELLIDKIKKTDGMFFVSPEYNGGVPPVLSNVLCWLSVSGDNWRELFIGKMAAIATHSGGNGQSLLRALSMQLEHLGMNIIGRKLLATYSQSLSTSSIENVVSQLIKLS